MQCFIKSATIDITIFLSFVNLVNYLDLQAQIAAQISCDKLQHMHLVIGIVHIKQFTESCPLCNVVNGGGNNDMNKIQKVTLVNTD